MSKWNSSRQWRSKHGGDGDGRGGQARQSMAKAFQCKHCKKIWVTLESFKIHKRRCVKKPKRNSKSTSRTSTSVIGINGSLTPNCLPIPDNTNSLTNMDFSVVIDTAAEDANLLTPCVSEEIPQDSLPHVSDQPIEMTHGSEISLDVDHTQTERMQTEGIGEGDGTNSSDGSSTDQEFSDKVSNEIEPSLKEQEVGLDITTAKEVLNVSTSQPIQLIDSTQRMESLHKDRLTPYSRCSEVVAWSNRSWPSWTHEGDEGHIDGLLTNIIEPTLREQEAQLEIATAEKDENSSSADEITEVENFMRTWPGDSEQHEQLLEIPSPVTQIEIFTEENCSAPSDKCSGLSDSGDTDAFCTANEDSFPLPDVDRTLDADEQSQKSDISSKERVNEETIPDTSIATYVHFQDASDTSRALEAEKSDFRSKESDGAIEQTSRVTTMVKVGMIPQNTTELSPSESNPIVIPVQTDIGPVILPYDKSNGLMDVHAITEDEQVKEDGPMHDLSSNSSESDAVKDLISDDEEDVALKKPMLSNDSAEESCSDSSDHEETIQNLVTKAHQQRFRKRIMSRNRKQLPVKKIRKLLPEPTGDSDIPQSDNIHATIVSKDQNYTVSFVNATSLEKENEETLNALVSDGGEESDENNFTYNLRERPGKPKTESSHVKTLSKEDTLPNELPLVGRKLDHKSHDDKSTEIQADKIAYSFRCRIPQASTSQLPPVVFPDNLAVVYAQKSSPSKDAPDFSGNKKTQVKSLEDVPRSLNKKTKKKAKKSRMSTWYTGRKKNTGGNVSKHCSFCTALLDKNDPSSKSKKVGSAEFPAACSECRSKYGEYKVIIKRKNNCETVFKCSECQRSAEYKTKTAVVSHFKVHTGIKRVISVKTEPAETEASSAHEDGHDGFITIRIDKSIFVDDEEEEDNDIESNGESNESTAPNQNENTISNKRKITPPPKDCLEEIDITASKKLRERKPGISYKF